MKVSLTGLLGSAVFITSTTTLQAAEQDPVIVTATRTAQTVDESLASVTVLTEEDIQRSQASSLQELLTGYTGMNFTNNGGAGKATSLFLRGTNSNHVVVLLDGIKIGSATTGDIPFQNIPVSQIERIEIVRGPRSSLYGSEAIGGVIQIFTKKDHSQRATNLSAGMGNYGTESYSLGFSGRGDTSGYHIQVSRFETDGFNAKDNSNPDDDGYKNDSLNAGFHYKFAANGEWSVNVLHSEGKSEYDGYSVASLYDERFFKQTVGTSIKLRPSSVWQTELTLGQNRDESDFIQDDVQTSRFDTKRRQAIWQNDFTLNQNNLTTLGIDYTKEKVDSTTSFAEDERENTGVFLQHQWTGQSNDLLLGLRQDDNQAFGKHETGNLAWGQDLTNTLRLIASYGTAFKAPTFNDLYYSGPGGAGNPNLKPEESKTAEIILRGQHWEISAYQTKVEKLIVWGKTAPYFYEPSNVENATIQGVDISAKKILGDWQHQVDISFVDPRDDKTDNILPRRSRKSLRLSSDRIKHNWQYGASLIAYGERFDDAANKNRVSGYWLLNLRANYNLDKEWFLQAKIENALDKDYKTVKDYNQAGTSIFASINYQGL